MTIGTTNRFFRFLEIHTGELGDHIPVRGFMISSYATMFCQSILISARDDPPSSKDIVRLPLHHFKNILIASTPYNDYNVIVKQKIW